MQNKLTIILPNFHATEEGFYAMFLCGVFLAGVTAAVEGVDGVQVAGSFTMSAGP